MTIIIITIIKINGPISILNQKDQEQKKTKRSQCRINLNSTFSCSRASVMGGSGGKEFSQLSGRKQQEFLESLIFSTSPNTDSSSN
jgi:hypothetical protein